MKFTNLFSLCLLALPTTFALRGTPQHSLFEQAATKRSLGNRNYTYRKWDGACRKYQNGDGAGSHGDEFHRYKKEDYPSLDKDWCKDKCDDKGSDCTGFEFKDKGDDSHCEIWSYQMRGYEHDDYKYCYVKVYDDDGDDDDDDDDEDDDPMYKHKDGACRKYRDGTGSGKRGEDFTRYYRKSKDWCKEECDKYDHCKGFEFFYKHGKRHCEIWWSYPRGYKSSDYFDCYVKKS